MYRMKGFDGFQFDDDEVLHQKINLQLRIDWLALVRQLDGTLTIKIELGTPHFYAQAFAIGRFQ